MLPKPSSSGKTMVRSCRCRLLIAGIVCMALLTIWQLYFASRLDAHLSVLAHRDEFGETNRSNNNISRGSNSSRNSSSSNNSRNSSKSSNRSSNNSNGSSSNNSPGIDHSIVVSWPAEQQSRKDQIQKACQAFREEQQRLEIQKRSRSRLRKEQWSPLTPEEELTLISQSRQDIFNFYVDDVYKLIYCNVPNVSSAPWKKLMILLSGSKYNSTDDISHQTTHVNNNLTTLSDKKYSLKRILFRLETFSKILTIRDPLDRLLSAYRNKFAEDAPLSNLYHNMYGSHWIPFVRRDSNHTGKLEFNEMLEYLSRHSGPTEKFNGHWKPIFDLCHPCTIQYDFIANFTTQEQDSNGFLAGVLNGTQKSGLRFPEVERSSTSDLLKELLPALDPELVRDVQRKYYKDYDMFGYRRYT